MRTRYVGFERRARLGYLLGISPSLSGPSVHERQIGFVRWRSLEKITDSDLERLCELAQSDLRSLFERRPQLGRLYAERLLCIALCQGAALHYVDGRNGVKDFDVWSFFASH